MTKAILVIDMPKNCSECLLQYDYLHCITTENKNCDCKDLKYTYEDCDYRPKNCPLKELPKKKGISLKEAIGEKCSCYSDGWNDCIDEILGEE